MNKLLKELKEEIAICKSKKSKAETKVITQEKHLMETSIENKKFESEMKVMLQESKEMLKNFNELEDEFKKCNQIEQNITEVISNIRKMDGIR